MDRDEKGPWAYREEPRWDRIENRREHPRISCAGNAEILLFPAGVRTSGKIINLSLGGCCVEVEEPVEEPIGTRVEVYLCLMGNTVQLPGILRNVRHDVWAGIQFYGVSPRKALQIQELIDELFSEFIPG